jgi:TonB family protein
MTITYMDGTKKSFTSKQIKNCVIDDKEDLFYNPAEKRIEALKNKRENLKERLDYINKQCLELKDGYLIGEPKVEDLYAYTLSYFPQDKSSVEGTVVVRVTVSPSGDVTSASVVRGSIIDAKTRHQCVSLARETKFNVPMWEHIERTGTLTYTIEEDIEPIISPTTSENGDVFTSAAQMPSFPGGDAAMMKYISSNMRYPQAAADNNIHGKVIVQMVIMKNGKIGEVKVVRSVDKDLDREAIRVCKSLPAFSPGRNANGDAVNVWYTLPVVFKLQGTY